MECQVEKLEHFRHILLFEFNRGTKAAEATTNICAVFADNVIGESTARKWFSRFKEVRFDISDTVFLWKLKIPTFVSSTTKPTWSNRDANTGPQ